MFRPSQRRNGARFQKAVAVQTALTTPTQSAMNKRQSEKRTLGVAGVNGRVADEAAVQLPRPNLHLDFA